jgi:hypothetical protein
MTKFFDDLIDPNQTAYFRDRSVADNLHSILIMKEHCQEEDLDAVSISLDVKKAFDLLSNKYAGKY